MATQPKLEFISQTLNCADLPAETWLVPEIGHFSVEKTLYDYQTDAIAEKSMIGVSVKRQRQTKNASGISSACMEILPFLIWWIQLASATIGLMPKNTSLGVLGDVN